ncbi:hypothetical protein WICMUC_003953 [Wickerhamomyces mucosus]|uniref:PITH domain-containing protein n=1 Tax=Wickerhamomyces mucosus TaxID=1378264 RepID=A0A9P8PK47_9ASCO|nr:hypothetical protein WICMUC_003953 [Wickerhamomyces mucosus]
MSCQHEHEHSHGHDHDHDHGDHVPPIPTNESQSLRQYIDFSKVRGLNIAQPNEEIYQIFKSQEDKFSLKFKLTSDADSQLILNIPFIGFVKIFSVILRTNGNEDHCPRTIKVFKNANDIDFDSDKKPTFVINHPLIGVNDDEIDEEDKNENLFIEHYLPRSKFQSTTQLTLFFHDNWSDDEDEILKIYDIELRGQFTSPLSKDPIVTVYESAANPTDHKNILAQENKNQSSI